MLNPKPVWYQCTTLTSKLWSSSKEKAYLLCMEILDNVLYVLKWFKYRKKNENLTDKQRNTAIVCKTSLLLQQRKTVIQSRYVQCKHIILCGVVVKWFRAVHVHSTSVYLTNIIPAIGEQGNLEEVWFAFMIWNAYVTVYILLVKNYLTY
jgi:hypothetical protein